MARHRQKSHFFVNVGLAILALSLFAFTGSRVISSTSAATANPYGSADYCTLENNVTVIYGWAADPDATSLADPSVTMNINGQDILTSAPTNRAGYRDNAVHAWIDANRTGDPKPGTYGFKASIPGLYKGSQNILSGIVLNSGFGSSTPLTINNTAHIDNDTSKPFFVNNLIPEQCLAVAPNDPAAAAAAVPASTATDPTKILPAPTISTEADASITVGTLAAQFVIHPGSANTIRIDYGTDPTKLDKFTSDLPTRGTDLTTTLTALAPRQNYSYRIIRKDVSGKTTVSPIVSFTTLGYIIALHFTDSQAKGIQGIPAAIDEQKAKPSNDNGDVQFTDSSGGSHIATFSYLGKKYSRTVTTNTTTLSPAETTAAKVITLDYAINIQDVVATPAKTRPTPHDSSPYIVTAAVATFAVLLIILTLIGTRQKRKRTYQSMLDAPAPPLPEYRPLHPPVRYNLPQEPEAAHKGESLKDLVLRSMQEEVQRRGENDKQ